MNIRIWRYVGECSWPAPTERNALSIGGINLFRHSWNPAGYAIVVPDPRDAARFHHIGVARIYPKPVPISEQTAVTFAAGAISDSSWAFYFPATSDAADSFEAGMPKHEGFWRKNHSEESSLPWPATAPDWPGSPDFLAALEKAEAVAEKIAYRGISLCRLCGRGNGNRSLRLNVWEWPEGFKHYIAAHSVRPSLDFERFIWNLSRG